MIRMSKCFGSEFGSRSESGLSMVCWLLPLLLMMWSHLSQSELCLSFGFGCVILAADTSPTYL
jgi:hypothetical protein